MTATFANLSVLADSDEDILDLLAGEDAFVSPPIMGWVTVFDRESDAGNLSRLAELTARLSSALDTAAIAFLVIEDDAFFYLLFQNGELIDEYASDPDYFGDTSDDDRDVLSGNIDALLSLSAPGTKSEQLYRLLREPGRTGAERARALADRLGIQNGGLGYSDLVDKAEGADIPVVGWGLFEHTGIDDDELAPPSANGHLA